MISMTVIQEDRNNTELSELNVYGKKLPITVTDLALIKLSELIEERRKAHNTIGVKIKIVSKGCGGNKYVMEYVEEENKHDEVIRLNNTVVIFLDPKALLKIIGTEMDYVSNKFETGFSFKNKREKGRCGCGESFYY